VAELETAVKATIRKAFARTPYPGDGKLVVARAGEDPECDQIAESFRGKTWKDLPAGLIRSYADSLPLFTAEAFRYYLPAYMLASLGSDEEPASVREPVAGRAPDTAFDWNDVVHFVLFRLTLPESPEDCEYFLARARQFSAEERKAIAGYLKLIAEQQEVDWDGEEPRPDREEIAGAIRFWEAADLSSC